MADLKIYANQLEQQALGQINVLANTPAFENAKIRIMPDAHAGAGCVIGFTADLGDKVVPNLVGVDIGCGMYTIDIPSFDFDDLPDFDAFVKQQLPSGFSVHNDETCDANELGLTCIGELQNFERLNRSLGTLGGGNHFVELDTCDGNRTMLVIHTGSRNLGLQVAQIYQRKALENCNDEHTSNDLKYLTGELRSMYLHDMRICQQWAKQNRELIAKILLDGLGLDTADLTSFHTVHNYIGDDDVVRKGAISAKAGEQVLIPFNMRDGAIIGVGLGNDDWNNSAPHGAGRLMSRARAKRELSVNDFASQMQNIYSTTVCESTLDEAPDAYKPFDEIMNAIEPTVKIIDRLKPVYNFKSV